MQSDKLLNDINGCIVELVNDFLSSKIPINDDSIYLHHLEEKLECVLLHGLKDKPNLIGMKKSYWEYICSCYSSSKKAHEGLKYVISMSELKTPLGRGRALLRFCLMQKCLADTLQSCFINEKVTKEFYADTSVPMQTKLAPLLISSLYDLNDINFDLALGHDNLDFNWPPFARKNFVGSENVFTEDHLVSSLPSFPKQILSEMNMEKFTVNATEDTKNILHFHPCSLNSCDLNKDVASNFIYSDQENPHKQLETQVKLLQDKNFHLMNKLSAMESILFKSDACKCSDLQKCHDLESFVDNVSTESNPVCDLNSLSMLDIQNSPCCEKIAGESDELHTEVNSEVDCDMKKSLKHLQEIKMLIESFESKIQTVTDQCLITTFLSHLENLRNSLEVSCNKCYKKIEKNNERDKNVDKCIDFIFNLVVKQDEIINVLISKLDTSVKENKNLFSKICSLRDLLHSYGLLKISLEKNVINESCVDINSLTLAADPVDEVALNDVLALESNALMIPLLHAFNSSLLKLKNIDIKVEELLCGLNSSQALNNNLLSRVQDQELRLKGVTRELEEAQVLVSVLKEQHQKLQSTEGILKYDLQEKRKMLTRLRKQLESTREDWNLVREKNSKSELEWKNLRMEFVQRHKQTSEESGFVDDKGLEEQINVSKNSVSEVIVDNKCDSSHQNKSCIGENDQDDAKKTRLELLEQQCKLLYSSLLQSSKKRKELDNRLETLCQGLKTGSENVNSDETSMILPDENANGDMCNPICDNFKSKLDETCSSVNSLQSSSEVGSLHSEYSLNLTNSANSVETKSSDCIIPALSLPLQSNDLHYHVDQQLTGAIIDVDSKNVDFNDKSLLSNCTSELMDISSGEDTDLIDPNLPCIFLTESLDSKTASCDCDFTKDSLTQIDTLLIKTKDLENCLGNIPVHGKSNFSSETIRSESTQEQDLSEQILSLEKEKGLLQVKMIELEKKYLFVRTELDRVKSQLLLSKTERDQEVSALQFQLNTEALKYERSLEQFKEQDRGLEIMKQKVTDQEQLIFALEQALTEIRTGREFEKEKQWQELEEIHFALLAREDECIALSENLEKSISDANEERNKNAVLISQLKEAKSWSHQDKITMEAELTHLREDTKALQKRLIKLLKEKDMLWKKSDHLTHLQNIKISYRWMNDHETSDCMGCKCHFSFLLRKHHCRLCGRIFCRSCANNWLFSPSSRHRIRVCNECYKEYIEIKKQTKCDTSISSIDDDSEDDTVVDHLSLKDASSSSFNSEILSTITNSIISLPLKENVSRGTIMSSSAPDLRFIPAQNEFKSD